MNDGTITKIINYLSIEPSYERIVTVSNQKLLVYVSRVTLTFECV